MVVVVFGVNVFEDDRKNDGCYSPTKMTKRNGVESKGGSKPIHI